MDLERLKIDRSPRRKRRGPWLRRGILLALLLAAVWVLRRPLTGIYERLTLPGVELVQAVRTSPLAAAAVSGTAANGYIVASRRAALSADTPGRIIEMNVEEGAVVRKGDVVARLYADEYRAVVRRAEAGLAAAEAAVARAEAELDAARVTVKARRSNVTAAKARLDDVASLVSLAQIDFDRATRLLESGAGTKQEVDEARTALERAKATRSALQAALTFAESEVAEAESRVAVATAGVTEARTRVGVEQAARDEAEATLDKTEVRAPFDGIVVLKDAEVGEVVSPNSQGANSRGSVVTMVDFASLEVQVDLPETTLAAVRIGGPASIYLDAFPEERYAGEVTRIWPTANRQKGTIELRVGFDAPDDRLRPEMGVRVVFTPEGEEAPAPEAKPEQVVLVPADCITRIEGQPGVFEVERDVARWREVALGERRGGRVVVTGLEGGESLVARPSTELKDGLKVRVVQ